MQFQRTSNTSPLSLFLLLSLGIHIVLAGFYVVFAKETPKPQIVEISLHTIDTPLVSSLPKQSTPSPIKESTPPVELPMTAKAEKITIPKEVIQKEVVKVEKPKTVPKPAPVKKAPAPTKKPTPVKQQQANPPTPVKQTPPPVKQPPAPVKPTPSPVKQTPTPVKPATTPTPPAPKDFSQELDQLLDKKKTKKTHSDFLADGNWSGSPRKTLTFPNLIGSIPPQYKARSYGFSVTAKITFSHQGWVSAVELVQGSGDPRIDGIFRTELRKIRVEPSKGTQYDTILKTFKVSVK